MALGTLVTLANLLCLVLTTLAELIALRSIARSEGVGVAEGEAHNENIPNIIVYFLSDVVSMYHPLPPKKKES